MYICFSFVIKIEKKDDLILQSRDPRNHKID